MDFCIIIVIVACDWTQCNGMVLQHDDLNTSDHNAPHSSMGPSISIGIEHPFINANARARYKNSHFWCVVVNESLFISLQFRSRVRLAFNPLIIVGRVHSACICGAVAYFPLESLHYFPIFALVPIILLHYKYKINFFYTSIYICIAGCSGLLHHTGQPKWKQQQHRRWKWTTLWTWENA